MPHPAAASAIDSFWSFWRENRPAITSAITSRTLSDWTGPISDHVRAVDPRLDWEMGAGHEAEHYFCVSAKGDMEVRVTAERWLSRAPSRDATWEFHAARPGSRSGEADWSLEFDGVVFALRDFRVVTDPDETRARIDLTVFHPSFARAPENMAMTATFIALDGLLGEDEVERWIGGIELATDAPPPEARTLSELARFVGDFRAASPADGSWVVLRGTLPSGSPAFVSANLGIKRVDHLLMDQHVELTIRLEDPTDEGLTTNEEAEALNALEDALLDALGPDAVYVGRETREGLRVLHFHVASGGPALGRIEPVLAASGRDVEVESRLDPTWEILRRW